MNVIPYICRMMKKYLILFFFLACFIGKGISQNEKKEPSEGVKGWYISEDFASEKVADVDTFSLNYQNQTTPMYKKTIGASWLGNLGLPEESQIFFDRDKYNQSREFIFKNPYLAYYYSPEDYFFFNTKTPYSNVSYTSGGYSYKEEDHLSGLFSVNANKKLNFTLLGDYIYGRGAYDSQSTNDLNGALYGSYRGDRYSIYFIASLNNFKNYENGGLVSDDLSDNSIESYNREVNMTESWSIFRSFYLYANQQYSIGFEKNDPNNSEKKIFVPVTTFGYTAKYENNQKKYYEKSITDFYAKNYYDSIATNDTCSYQLLKNVASISLNEGFHNWAIFGIRAFAEFDVEQNMCLNGDSALSHTNDYLLYVGGELSRKQGIFQYDATGKLMLFGDKRGELDLNGNFETNIPLNKQVLRISGNGFMTNTPPSFFKENYYSNHFIWNNSFDNIFRTRVYGNIALPNNYCDFSVGAGWENITNYVYFNKDAVPEQYSGSIEILSGDAKLNLTLWKFHLDNKATYQISSEDKILPLPLLSLYSNIYVKSILFKVLHFQLGVDCRYNTAYYANAYMPATGQFYLQDETRIGDYPLMNVYANFHLKRTRFFLMYYNISDLLFDKKEYFTVPNYALNPGMFKFGISWNFYD